MLTYTGTSGNDSWTVINPGTFTLDGWAEADTLYPGTLLRTDYTISSKSAGRRCTSTQSVGRQRQAARHAVFNGDLVFNNKRDTLDLTTYFGDSTRRRR